MSHKFKNFIVIGFCALAFGQECFAQVDDSFHFTLTPSVVTSRYNYKSPGFSTLKTSQTGMRLSGNFIVNRWWGLSFAYSNYGKGEDNVNNLTFLNSVSNSLDVQVLNAFGMGRFRFNERIALFAKLGLSYVYFDEEIGPVNDSGGQEDVFEVTGGIGIEYGLTRNLSIDSEIGRMNDVNVGLFDQKSNLSLAYFSLGLTYHFNN